MVETVGFYQSHAMTAAAAVERAAKLVLCIYRYRCSPMCVYRPTAAQAVEGAEQLVVTAQ